MLKAVKVLGPKRPNQPLNNQWPLEFEFLFLFCQNVFRNILTSNCQNTLYYDERLTVCLTIVLIFLSLSLSLIH